MRFDQKSNFGPTKLETTTDAELVRIAFFGSNNLRVTANEFEVPFEVKFDLNDRFHLVVSGGPTLTLFNSNFETSVYAQELTNVNFQSRVLKNQTSYSVLPHDGDGTGTQGTNTGSGGVLKGSSGSNTLGGGGRTAGRSSGTTGGGGKAATVSAPRLPGRNVATWRSANKEQNWQWGAFAQLGLTVDLDSQDKWFAEFFGRYQWVDDFTVSNDLNSATIDPSSWAVGLGLGRRF